MKVSTASFDPALLPPAVKLARSLAVLVRGLVYGMSSEGDHAYRPFSAVMAKETELNAETFRKAARLGRRYHIQLDQASRFF
jgi:hypothetical protein